MNLTSAEGTTSHLKPVTCLYQAYWPLSSSNISLLQMHETANTKVDYRPVRNCVSVLGVDDRSPGSESSNGSMFDGMSASSWNLAFGRMRGRSSPVQRNYGLLSRCGLMCRVEEKARGEKKGKTLSRAAPRLSYCQMLPLDDVHPQLMGKYKEGKNQCVANGRYGQVMSNHVKRGNVCHCHSECDSI